MILDVGLPDINGFELCKQIRLFSDLPIIFLTARSDEIDRVVGLEIGADDYVTKPFSPREMLARVKIRLKRHLQPVNIEPQVQQVLIESTADFDFKCHGHSLGLTAIEYKVLAKLFNQPKQVFSREQLLNTCGVANDVGYERNIDSHIKTLRQKIKRKDHSLDVIKTKRGFGYFYEQTPS
ncbi:two-component system, OmpR family, catabolic regulation response regulator CreB [Pseudoalteromonas denitrificans DSM 6059]|uniref:Two-component system, OmpR family, catabolic regulation response regulator CreB n=1 Tax=Pseudoalteromonas denitrificans DSM 6059 TaxID=1123010 RepID=A0A1I1KH09_9GAMM|nr:two-component system, OmpR family, catabolic regulation response regulator CreB [Pseudoalteromonas denitrificans DSM 6059]